MEVFDHGQNIDIIDNIHPCTQFLSKLEILLISCDNCDNLKYRVISNGPLKKHCIGVVSFRKPTSASAT